MTERVRKGNRSTAGSPEHVGRVIVSMILSAILIFSFTGCDALRIFQQEPEEEEIPASINLQKAAEASCFTWDNTIITGLTETGKAVKNLVIPEKATEIAESAFKENTTMISVGFQNPAVKLGQSVFVDCTSLEMVQLPSNIVEVPTSLFQGCKSLLKIEFPESVTHIGDMAFYQCTALETVSHGEGLTSIGRQAFHTCNNLKGFKFTSGITVIDQGAFAWCNNLESVILTDTKVEMLEGRCFSNCDKLTIVELPEGITKIGAGVFTQCPKLASVRLPESIVEIETTAFKNTENKNADPKKFFVVKGSYAETNFTLYAHQNDTLEYYTAKGV